MSENIDFEEDIEEEPEEELEEEPEEELEEVSIQTEDLLTNRPPFRKEELKNAHYLRSTSFEKDLLEYIDHSRLYESARRALKSSVMNYFNSVWFLGNFQEEQSFMKSTFGSGNNGSKINSVVRIWNDLKLDMLENTISMCRSDRMSPDMINVKKALKSHFKAIISRAVGPRRERLENTKITASQEVIQRNITQPSATMQPRSEKKSFWK